MHNYLEGVCIFLLIKIILLRDGMSGYAEVDPEQSLKNLLFPVQL